MKSNSIWRFLFNPFTRIAGWQAFLIGIVIAALTGAIGGLNNVWFGGVLDMHWERILPYSFGFVMIAIDIISIVLCVCGSQLCSYQKVTGSSTFWAP